jgi:hypothetical protein
VIYLRCLGGDLPSIHFLRWRWWGTPVDSGGGPNWNCAKINSPWWGECRGDKENRAEKKNYQDIELSLTSAWVPLDLRLGTYYWILLRKPPRVEAPSIILCVFEWSLPALQRRGLIACEEGKNGRLLPITEEQSRYKKISLS